MGDIDLSGLGPARLPYRITRDGFWTGSTGCLDFDVQTSGFDPDTDLHLSDENTCEALGFRAAGARTPKGWMDLSELADMRRMPQPVEQALRAHAVGASVRVVRIFHDRGEKEVEHGWLVTDGQTRELLLAYLTGGHELSARIMSTVAPLVAVAP